MRNDPRDNLLDVHRKHVQAWEQKSLERLAEIYAEDAIIFFTHPPARFSDYKTFENTINQHLSELHGISIFTSNIQIDVEDRVAWLSSQYLKVFRSHGQLHRQSGRWTEIYRRVDEKEWRLVHFHASLDPA